MSKISAVVPTFNRAHYLVEAVESLLKQTRAIDQIIIWDDGSTDNTHDVVTSRFADKVTYLRSENRGKSAALNNALSHVSGDYVWICDDDDIAAPDAAERLARPLDQNPDIGIVSGGYQRFSDVNGKRQYFDAGYWPDLTNGTPLRHILEDIFLFQNATLVRKTCYTKVGGFSEVLPRSIDYDMLVRLAVRYRVHVLDGVLFYQRKHEGVRGPLWAQHNPAESDQHWHNYDRALFETLRDDIPLSLFQAMYEASNTEVVMRAAFLQRACVYARRNSWALALDDLEMAVNCLPHLALTAIEAHICRRAVSGKHGVHPEKDDVRRLSALRNTKVSGASIAGALRRGLMWSLKRAALHADVKDLTRLGGLALRHGLQPAPAFASVDLKERDQLPEDAYKW